MTIDLIALVQPYLLIFARISAVFMMAPGLSDTHIPMRYRLLFSLALAIAFKDILPIPITSEKIDGVLLVALLVQETIIGSIIGFIARLLLSILDVLGNILSLQTGLGNAMVFNPSMGGQTPVLDNFVILSGLMLFFAMDLHYLVIRSVIQSYHFFPIHTDHPLLGHFLSSLEKLPLFFSKSFTIACQLSLPFLILGVVFQFMLGLLNRVVPNIQIFFISLPLQILLGFVLIFTILALVLHLSLQNFSELYAEFLPQ